MSDFAPERLTLAALRERGMPTLFERDPLAWRRWLVADMEARTGRTFYPDQTETLLLETAAYGFALQAEAMQAAARANMTVFAEGELLDIKAAENGIFRLSPQFASCAVAALLPGGAPRDLVVPAGTVLSAGRVLFATAADIVLPAGEVQAVGHAVATLAGPAANGFAPGEVAASLGLIAAGLSLENAETTAGGTDVEDDERLRQSAVDGPEAFGRRGHWAGYGLAVRRVSPAIIDVAIDRPVPGRIDLVIHTEDGPPSAELLERVLDATDPETDAPHGDSRSARGPVEHVFDLALEVRREPNVTGAADEAAIREAVEAAMAVMRRPLASGSRRTKFAFETGPLGAQFAPGAIITAVGGLPGIIDVALPGAAFLDLPFDRVARLGALSVTFVDATDV